MTAWAKLCLAALVVMLVTCRPAVAQSSNEAIAQTLPRIVKIYGAGGLRNLYAYSTGFLVSPEGHIATVWSHVLDSDSVLVVLNDGRRLEAKVLGAEPRLDLAVLKLQDENLDLPYFNLSTAAVQREGSPLPIGTRILGFNNMFKVASGDEPVSVLHGVIEARTTLSARRGAYEIPYDFPVYIVDAVTNNPGAGGGVITTYDGRLVGMIGKELRNASTNTWVNYAIPVGELREVIEQIISGRFEKTDSTPQPLERPNRYEAIDFGLVMVPDVLNRTPAYIDSVIDGSSAARAGLRPDDLILFVNDQLVHSLKMLKAELGRLQAGDTLRLVVRRGKDLVSVELPVPRKEQHP